MSKLTKEDVFKLAQLSRLKITDSEAEHFSKEFSSILDYVEMLSSAELTGLLPTYQVTGLQNVTRADQLVTSGPYSADNKELLKNAPELSDGQFKVKRMVG